MAFISTLFCRKRCFCLVVPSVVLGFVVWFAVFHKQLALLSRTFNPKYQKQQNDSIVIENETKNTEPDYQYRNGAIDESGNGDLYHDNNHQLDPDYQEEYDHELTLEDEEYQHRKDDVMNHEEEHPVDSLAEVAKISSAKVSPYKMMDHKTNDKHTLDQLAATGNHIKSVKAANDAIDHFLNMALENEDNFPNAHESHVNQEGRLKTSVDKTSHEFKALDTSKDRKDSADGHRAKIPSGNSRPIHDALNTNTLTTDVIYAKNVHSSNANSMHSTNAKSMHSTNADSRHSTNANSRHSTNDNSMHSTNAKSMHSANAKSKHSKKETSLENVVNRLKSRPNTSQTKFDDAKERNAEITTTTHVPNSSTTESTDKTKQNDDRKHTVDDLVERLVDDNGAANHPPTINLPTAAFHQNMANDSHRNDNMTDHESTVVRSVTVNETTGFQNSSPLQYEQEHDLPKQTVNVHNLTEIHEAGKTLREESEDEIDNDELTMFEKNKQITLNSVPITTLKTEKFERTTQTIESTTIKIESTTVQSVMDITRVDDNNPSDSEKDVTNNPMKDLATGPGHLPIAPPDKDSWKWTHKVRQPKAKQSKN